MDKVARGRMAHHAGDAAERRIALDYERRGFTVAQRRWRGGGGEIDLVLRNSGRNPGGLVFVEVKHSRSIARAAESLRPAQMRRIRAAAELFLAGEPAGQLTDMRIDVALVDGTGAYEIIENAFGQG
ncbi:YraN family protein [Pukyongiella litopenaei]|uniref:UPF0102 protein C6Y53_10610 n=1 Tax=Pukyongiella litopenaei TaxID=2605946 RepID=A0A2S0MQG3_9RHOB|nr:YraN family protein [Pukyongiella litopenaei]AVO38114.1 hypothetical protein C6Y53_10610 [Pukyongiella litopenaei]